MFEAYVSSVLTSLGLTKGATIAGFFGALLSLKLIAGLTPGQGVLTVFSGMVCAGYVSPFLIHEGWFSHKSENAIAFLIGLLGMIIVAAAVKEIPSAIAMLKEKLLK